ncbi:Nif11-like leader peptide family natural product precursor [Cylindrospermum sp. FACHB-282]|uniref:Nif11-like leader peptide family natural product precursor n=1 Tax=Cylindrospermum sp. FACHB-282 TaxID=2692794 RepID=UPI0016876A38|nr:Nif11-like leader peptide family natural product precursor [Cylindrospermum sp. FACHB-282]MBD2387086.1 Nif11-like leader peptide family natural product precursor [Cylindrospermum sp. FACHB-282]
MSTNDKLHQFLQAVSENLQLQQELLAVLEAAEDDRQATAELAQKYGYELSAEEIGDGIERIQSEFLTVNQVLSDAELETVSGGGNVSADMVIAPLIKPLGVPKPKW